MTEKLSNFPPREQMISMIVEHTGISIDEVDYLQFDELARKYRRLINGMQLNSNVNNSES